MLTLPQTADLQHALGADLPLDAAPQWSADMRSADSIMDPDDVLRAVFGYRAWRGEQGDIVRHVTRGDNALVLMPTGGGKSLCFQVPALARPGCAIVISPLLALMRDQVTALKAKHVAAEALTSETSIEERRRIANLLKAGKLDILYMSPERFVQDRTIETLREVKIALYAVDEAHCISEWGHDFRPEYRQIRSAIDRLRAAPIVAVTATADRTVEEDIVNSLGIQGARRFRNSFDRPNINIMVQEPSPRRGERFMAFVEGRRGSPGIIYRNTIKGVLKVAETLRTNGIDPIVFHGQLPKEEKQEALNRFLQDKAPIVVATMAFGMGIDRGDIRWVAHLDMPRSLASYYQEIGRAGRDGAPSIAALFYAASDYMKEVRLAKYGADPILPPPDKDLVRRRLRELGKVSRFLATATCRRKALLQHFGELHSGDCGRCDRCLHPVRERDATKEAILLIEAAQDTGHRHGATGLAAHLLGITPPDDPPDTTVRRKKSFGSGVGIMNADAWQHLARQMVLANIFGPHDDAEHQGYRVTQLGKEVLMGRLKICATMPPSTHSSSITPAREAEPAAGLPEPLRRLYIALRNYRTEMAERSMLQPSDIFSNSVLDRLVIQQPRLAQEVADTPGMPPYQAREHGVAIADIISRIIPPPVINTRIQIPGVRLVAAPRP